MKAIQNILVVMAFDTLETPAMQRAKALAEKTGAMLHLFTVEYNEALLHAGHKDGAALETAIAEYVSSRRQQLEFVARQLSECGLTVKTDVAWGRPAYGVITEKVLQLNPDLVIKDIHPESFISKIIFTPEDWLLLRHCPAPLMLVNPKAHILPKRVIAAVDPLDMHGKPHELNSNIIEIASEIAAQCNADTHIVHAFDDFPPPSDPMDTGVFMDRSKMAEENREIHKRALIDLARQCDVPDEQLHFKDGAPAKVIAGIADDIHADLVVLGTVMRHGLNKILIGSTAEKILDKINCDVLAVKPEGFEESLREEFTDKDWTGMSHSDEHARKLGTHHL
ncbi:MAG: universal stress protein [Gammaproteobacteria bacterium]|nr:universal stress protein [Gammaproteobacteria bacterium]